MALSSQGQVGGILLRMLTPVEDGVFGMVGKEKKERERERERSRVFVKLGMWARVE